MLCVCVIIYSALWLPRVKLSDVYGSGRQMSVHGMQVHHKLIV